MARTLRNLTSLILLFGAPKVLALESLSAYWDNVLGVREIAKKQYYKGYQDFLKALAKKPLSPDVQLNLGLSLELSEDFEKAEKANLAAHALAGDDKQKQFVALFNLAETRSHKEDVNGALEAYQAALAIEPESLEVKTNIELLTSGKQGQGSSKNGKGKGKDDDKKDQKDPNKNDNKDQKRDGPYEQPKKQPKPFDSKDLSKEDVRKILGEIQNQEQSIRAKEYDKGAKERSRDKDW